MRAHPNLRPARRASLARDCEGTAAIEFALITPLLVTMFLGTYELSNLLIANMKVTAATQTAADLVARTEGSGVYLQSTDLDSIAQAAGDILLPLPSSPFHVAFASISYNTTTFPNAPAIDWHYEYNGATPISLTTQVMTMLNGLGTASTSSTDSVILVSVTYNYTSPISYVLSKTYTFTDTAANRPRFLPCVPSNVNNSTKTTCP